MTLQNIVLYLVKEYANLYTGEIILVFFSILLAPATGEHIIFFIQKIRQTIDFSACLEQKERIFVLFKRSLVSQCRLL